ncbi:Ribonuclease H2 subunit A [Monocercomonoides exilis]|uniref:Ribonuclease H2 subunit A n=1 Tax=Monocercomonoides exilis TaxID=2049356 RepID=UPI00355A0D1F|nr:Ribonuclease H2 subunit A [Monocercomonoides exilis]|eukprot:MONOS_9262.1-p1 / transcript=MONOS_9262.1 / gene=MONOS_9262 / organism=Monocercomonoides_exilis_PA203 / gene_product=Ribonuclease H2 subunit A / transcript_product=Ribonuclease H2 subunit A / location=Mono_scaffold00375:52007-53400(-) / protein_length=283 / sequence_SO=supercontig / SO=protein_coding / is_pseudo=false
MEKVFAGIDEAGRGPVLGPMVYAVGWAPMSKKTELSKMGFKDSKVLTEAQRDSLFEKIRSTPWIEFETESASPEYISSQMLKKEKKSLNKVAMECVVKILNGAKMRGAVIEELYVDTLGPPAKYKEFIQRHFPEIPSITVTSKADALFPIVSAASICAKVTRDRSVRNWRFREKSVVHPDEVGSGYPGDPVTKRWLLDNFDPFFCFPSFVRFSWATAHTFAKQHGAVEMKWEADDEELKEKEKEQSQLSIASLFPKAPTATNTSQLAVSHSCFFSEAHLNFV